MKKGMFIVLEGMDGSGKTTQIERLRNYFREQGKTVYLTREPGGTMISEAIREIILSRENEAMVDTTEALLYAASRAQHVAEVIRPVLERGETVICDRYIDSSIVYQGFARGLGMNQVETINLFATGGLWPDLTILLEVPENKAIERKGKQKELDRLEIEAEEFHQKVRQGYRLLLEKSRRPMIVLDAKQPIEVIHQAIIKAIQMY